MNDEQPCLSKIQFSDGDSFQGSHNILNGHLDGIMSYSNNSEFIREESIDFEGNELKLKKDQKLIHFPENTKIKSIQCLENDSSDRQITKIIYNNGDIFTGFYQTIDLIKICFEGTITYSDDRYPPFTGRIRDNKPMSGEGICYLHNIGVRYEGKFSDRFKYTKYESDGTVTTINSERSCMSDYPYNLDDSMSDCSYDQDRCRITIEYPYGKKFEGFYVDYRKLFYGPLGKGFYRNYLGENFDFEGEITEEKFINASFTNIETGTKFSSDQFERYEYGGCKLVYKDCELEMEFKNGQKSQIKCKNNKVVSLIGEIYEEF